MKKSLILVGLSALCMSSCVTLGKYEALESRNAQLRREFNTTQSELSDLRDENANLQRQNQSLNTQITDLNDLRTQLSDSISGLRRDMSNLKMGYDTVIENYNQRITGQSQDLSRTNNLLAARTKELSDKEAAFQLKEAAFQAKEAEFRAKESEFRIKEDQLLSKQSELERKEADARQALEAKERELENLRTKLNNALVGFADKGLKVETRDGKVYVSMDSKLLFPSASWTVSKDGNEAIKSLAAVLEQNTDLNIMVEGHTDNAAYKGSSAVKDNWDLSVMRATSIVKLLLKYGSRIDPARIEACGHAEFAPKVPNDSPANKALNRRTEIILTPKMTDILNIIEK
ncbi:MAG: OmpA family protein [Bacteroidales bacterium]|nr:OmpA family protein [Bacteroidales bacterium]